MDSATCTKKIVTSEQRNTLSGDQMVERASAGLQSQLAVYEEKGSNSSLPARSTAK